MNFEGRIVGESPKDEAASAGEDNVEQVLNVEGKAEKPREVKKRIEALLLEPEAALNVIDLMRTELGLMEEYLQEFLNMRKQPHTYTPKGWDNAVTRHKEGDVWKHTLHVIAALEKKEFIQAVRNVYGLDDSASPEDVREVLFEKCGTEFIWAILLHDIGKCGTAKPEMQDLDDEKTAYYFSFRGHEKRSSELFEGIAQRLDFPREEAEKIHQLIEDHMVMHEIARGGSVTPERKREIFQKPNSEALLFLQFADALGNYTDRSPHQKADAFYGAWDEMMKYSEKDEGQAFRRAG